MQRTSQMNPGDPWQPWRGDTVGLGALPSAARADASTPLAGCRRCPRAEGTAGTGGPWGKSMGAGGWVQGALILPLAAPRSTAGECPAPPCHPQLPTMFVAQGLVGMMATSLWPRSLSPNSKAPVTPLLAGALIFFFPPMDLSAEMPQPQPCLSLPWCAIRCTPFPKGFGC